MVRSAYERPSSFWIGFLIWAICSVILVYIELGILAFVGSVILGVWVFGMRDKFEGETTASAYSVFNKGGKSLPGSLTVHDIDQQLRSGGIVSGQEIMNDADGPAESKTSGIGFTGFALTQSQDERDRRRRAAADAALRRRNVTNS